jgi:hypothetical protein
MKKGTWRRRVVAAALAGGCLYAGPCGITSLQLQDFLTSALIRTGVSTLATVAEAFIVDTAQESDGG